MSELITVSKIKFKPEGNKPGLCILGDGREAKWWPKTVKGIVVGISGFAEIEATENEYGEQNIIQEFTPQGTGGAQQAPTAPIQAPTNGNSGKDDYSGMHASIESQVCAKCAADIVGKMIEQGMEGVNTPDKIEELSVRLTAKLFKTIQQAKGSVQ